MLKQQFQKFFDEVEQKYPQILPDISREEAQGLYAQGYALYEKEHYAEAIDIFRLLVVHQPLEAKYWFSLAACLQQENQYELALSAWAVVCLMEKDQAEPHFHAAECCFSLEKSEDGHLALNEALSRTTDADPLREKIKILQECWSK